MKMKKTDIFLLAIVGIIVLAGLGFILYMNDHNRVKEYSMQTYAMDTTMSVTVYVKGNLGKDIIQTCTNVINDYDAKFSTTDPSSIISLLNENHRVEVDYKTRELLLYAKKIYEQTGGAFDPSTYPLTELWGFTSTPKLPSEEDIKNTLSKCGYNRVEFSKDSESGKYVVSIDDEMKLGLGAIAKGFVADEICKYLEKGTDGESIRASSALISLGGNVYVYGNKPDGSKWKIGIKNPYDDGNEYLGILSVSDTAIVTSAGYERNFTDDSGKVWHHIIDPETGYSADSGLVSVTVVSSDSTLADALSTAFYVMGLDKSIEYYHTYGDDFDMVLATADRVYITPGLQSCISGDYEYTIIK